MSISTRARRAGLVAGIIGASFAVQSLAADGQVSRGELLASMCVTCHGVGGAGAQPNPSINGQTVEDFVDLMLAFASGDEPATIMNRHSTGYTEDEIRAIAEYFSTM